MTICFANNIKVYKKCYSESHYKEETVYTFLKVYFLECTFLKISLFFSVTNEFEGRDPR